MKQKILKQSQKQELEQSESKDKKKAEKGEPKITN